MTGGRDAVIEHNRRASEAYQAGDVDEAARGYERAARALGPHDDDLAPAVYENLGMAQHARARPRAAAQAFLRALDGQLASREQSLRFLVVCLVSDGRAHDAVRALLAYETAFGPHPSGLTAPDIAPCCAGEVARHAEEE